MVLLAKKIIYGLWNVWFYVLAGIGVVLCFPLLIIFLQRDRWYRHVFWIGRWVWSPIILYGMGFWPKFTRHQTLEKGKNYMFVANHLSMIDIMLMLMAVRNPFVFVGKRELEEIPVFNYIYRRAAIKVDRDNYDSRKNVYHHAQKKLDMGYSVCIYPEGLVPHPDVFLGPFKNGAFSLAIQYQMPIVPVTLPDCKKRFPFQFGHKYWFGTPGKARAIVHPAIETKGLTKDDIPALKEQTHQFFQNQLRKEGYT
jgi:1-acyl-sn-glycerol-3-phosphate acyltransferase